MTPRSQLPTDELLSACHDGELTASERAKVDRLLSDNPALQETLDDFRELTSVLQSLPRPQAPPRLQADVLRRVQTVRPPTSAGPGRRFPWLWGLSLAATAAMLMVLIGRSVPSPNPAEVAVASRAAQIKDDDARIELATGETTSTTDHMADSAAGLSASSVAKESLAPATVTTKTESDSAEQNLPRPVISAAAAPASPASDSALGLPYSVGGAVVSRLRFSHDNPPAVADVLAHVFESDGQTMVVEFDVVNVDQTSRDMLVLLRQRGVTMVSAAQDESHPIAGTISQRSTTTGEAALVAVYVEATEMQLASVVDDMLTQMAISDGAAFNTSLAGPELGQQFQRMEDLYGERFAEPSAAVASPTRSVVHAPQAGAARPQQRQPADVAEASPAEVRAADAPAVAVTSQPRGVQLTISERAYRQIESQGQSDNKTARRPSPVARRAAEQTGSLGMSAQPGSDSAVPAPPAAMGGAAGTVDGVRQMLIVLRSPMTE
ncbi:MAG: anti-sigma factor family protein [Planctomycetaceae bacterium]